MNVIDRLKVYFNIKLEQIRILKKRVKKKLKSRVPISKLKEMLEKEKSNPINWKDYRSWDSDSGDKAYAKAIRKKADQIKLLEELIDEHNNKK